MLDCAFVRGASDGAVPVSISPIPEGFMAEIRFVKNRTCFGNFGTIRVDSGRFCSIRDDSGSLASPGFDFATFMIFFSKSILAVSPSGMGDMETGVPPLKPACPCSFFLAY